MTLPLTACFVCGASDKTPAFDGTYTPFGGSPGYGSRFDMTGNLQIHVCDDCLEGRSDRVTLVTISRPEPEVETRSWACGVCGDLAREGECAVGRSVAFLEEVLDDPKLAEEFFKPSPHGYFMIGVRTEERVQVYLDWYQKHVAASDHDLSGFRFHTVYGEDRAGKCWTVYAVRD